MRVVLANGIFDLLHVGHLRHLEEARSMGDKLVVGLTMDSSAEHEKRRPIIPESERMEMLLGLTCVSNVMLVHDGVEALELVRPAVLCKGGDYSIQTLPPAVIQYCAEHGIEIKFTRPNPHTTSGIIERIKSI